MAVQNGVLHNVGWNRLGGWRLWIEDTGGNWFYYAHLSAYAPIAKNGAHVSAGDVVGFVGHTGDAISTPSHLHFEIHPGGQWAVPPYDYLQAWQGHRNPFAAIPAEPPPVAGAQLESTDISAASGLDTAAVVSVASGSGGGRQRPGGARGAGTDGERAAGRSAGAMTLETALGVLREERAPAYRSQQLTHAVYSELAERWDEVTALPRSLRERLERDAPLRTLTEEGAQRAEDGTIKLRLRTHDGYPLEAVAMSHGPRRTVCLSSQSGCALACTFCATGRMGLGRNLAPEEISEQLLRLARLLRDEQDARVSNVVMMGMGEPFHNYENVLAAIRTINSPEAFGLGARQIAISTAGWIPGIDKLAEEPLQVKLALSLHAPEDELRSKLMPVTKRYPIAALMEACRRYRERTRRRVFIEYLLLAGVNDSSQQARQLVALLRKGGPGAFHVNLIAYNPTGSEYVAADDASVRRFRGELERGGIGTSYRVSRGRGIDAACGQLVMQGIPARKRAG